MESNKKQNTMKLEPITLNSLEVKWLLRDLERVMATADPDENIYMHIKQINKNK